MSQKYLIIDKENFQVLRDAATDLVTVAKDVKDIAFVNNAILVAETEIKKGKLFKIHAAAKDLTLTFNTIKLEISYEEEKQDLLSAFNFLIMVYDQWNSSGVHDWNEDEEDTEKNLVKVIKKFEL